MRLRAWLWAVLLVLHVSLAFAQQNVEKPQQQVDGKPPDLLQQAIAASQEIAGKGQPSVVGDALPETPKMLQAREEYTIYAWKNRRDAFAWQSASTKVIFVVVIIVVLAGLYLSWMQFHFAHNAPLKAAALSTEGLATTTPTTNPVDAMNTIEVNTAGVKITSSVIGLVILVLSIAFFFLYLKFVYPIIEV